MMGSFSLISEILWFRKRDRNMALKLNVNVEIKGFSTHGTTKLHNSFNKWKHMSNHASQYLVSVLTEISHVFSLVGISVSYHFILTIEYCFSLFFYLINGKGKLFKNKSIYKISVFQWKCVTYKKNHIGQIKMLFHY